MIPMVTTKICNRAAELGNSVTVTVNAVDPEIGNLYSFVVYEGPVYKGKKKQILLKTIRRYEKVTNDEWLLK